VSPLDVPEPDEPDGWRMPNHPEQPFDPGSIRLELDAARATFNAILEFASEEDLSRQSNGTRWTNRQLLFHMMFGYMVTRSLLILVKGFGRLPLSYSRLFSRVLDTPTGTFNLINYQGSCAGALIYRDRRMEPKFDAVIASLQRHLARERRVDMEGSMAFPVRWDPFFRPVMTLAEVYHYPTQHFEFHRRQLTLRASEPTP
jgi:hypothetical protein